MPEEIKLPDLNLLKSEVERVLEEFKKRYDIEKYLPSVFITEDRFFYKFSFEPNKAFENILYFPEQRRGKLEIKEAKIFKEDSVVRYISLFIIENIQLYLRHNFDIQKLAVYSRIIEPKKEFLMSEANPYNPLERKD